jgi:ABC-type lipoprotein export system ATPase subunit
MLLSLGNISKAFGDRDEGNFRPVLTDLSLKLQKGDTTAILGPSGSGKTTLLNIIGGLDQPDSGSVFFQERDMKEMSEKELDVYRNRDIGFVFQLHHLLPQCTVLENVLIPTLTLRDRSEKMKKRERAEELLNRVGIWDHRNKVPSKLSGGECQRVAVVRAMINEPFLLLADEPTGSLDEKNAENISELLLDLNQAENVSLLVVTHSAELASKMHKRFRIVKGSLQQEH